MQAKEVDKLLKKVSHDVFWYDDDTESQQFVETDIDQLLEQSARTVTNGSSMQSTMSSGLGSFSKASFFASTEDVDGQDVEPNGPDFWEKDVGLEASHESIGGDGMKVIFEKIRRKKVKVYDPHAEFYELCPDPNILLLSVGTALNKIIR